VARQHQRAKRVRKLETYTVARALVHKGKLINQVDHICCHTAMGGGTRSWKTGNSLNVDRGAPEIAQHRGPEGADRFTPRGLWGCAGESERRKWNETESRIPEGAAWSHAAAVARGIL